MGRAWAGQRQHLVVYCMVQWCPSPRALFGIHPRDPMNTNQLQSQHLQDNLLWCPYGATEDIQSPCTWTLKIQILNLPHIPLFLLGSPEIKRGENLKSTHSPRGIHTKLKIQISPSTPATLSLVWATWPAISPGVATGDPGIPGSTEYRCAGEDAALLGHQVTPYFPSHLFGHGNSDHVFPELQRMEENIPSTSLLCAVHPAHPCPDQCRMTPQGPLGAFLAQGYSERSYYMF